MKLYRNKYLIGVYAPVEEGETLMALCQNVSEFAKLMGVAYRTASQILHNLFTHHTGRIRFCGRLCSVEFILEVDEQC